MLDFGVVRCGARTQAFVLGRLLRDFALEPVRVRDAAVGDPQPPLQTEQQRGEDGKNDALGHAPSLAAYSAIGSAPAPGRSEEHTYELQSLMRNSYAVFCSKIITNETWTNAQ